MRKHAHLARTQTRASWPSTWLLLKAMGAGAAGRITYAAASRLDDIGRRAIGDMVSSAGVEFVRVPYRASDQPKYYRPRLVFGQISTFPPIAPEYDRFVSNQVRRAT